VKSGLEGLGSDLVDSFSDLELGLSEELVIGLGGEEVSQEPEVGFGGLTERLIDSIGQSSLVGGQG
jgi:hypothetical protein